MMSEDKLTNLRAQIAALTQEELASLKAEEEGQEGFRQA